MFERIEKKLVATLNSIGVYQRDIARITRRNDGAFVLPEDIPPRELENIYRIYGITTN